jgi:hypothetical protein
MGGRGVCVVSDWGKRDSVRFNCQLTASSSMILASNISCVSKSSDKDTFN